MKKIYSQIWSLAKPYYEKGRKMDIEHIEWMMKEAETVCNKEEIDETLLMPLVILHDVGYSVSKHAYFEKDLKKEHMEKGSDIAKKILQEIKYPIDKIEKIVYDISVHDNWIYGENDVYKDKVLGVFNDLDFTWMVTPKGFVSVMKILKMNEEELIDYVENNEKLKNRAFSTKITARIFEKYLEDRKAQR